MTGRTALLPTVDKINYPRDYRPPIVLLVIPRTLLLRVLAKMSVTVAPLPWSQKCFPKEEGCAANLALIDAAIRQAVHPLTLLLSTSKKRLTPSITLPSLEPARGRRVGGHFSNYVANVYEKASTIANETPSCINRGVVQEDPLPLALLDRKSVV